jgi:membrane-associated phospholipid phosphatase
MMGMRRVWAAGILVVACRAIAAAQTGTGGTGSSAGAAAGESATFEAAAPASAQDEPDIPVAPEADPNDKPFVRIIPNLLTDLRQLVSTKDNAITWAIGGTSTLALLPFDHDVSDDLSAPSSDGLMHAATVFGSGYVQFGGAVATYVVGRLAHHKATAHIGADLVRSQVLTGFVTHGLKRIVRRDRPETSDGSTATFSFPSAHASATWTSASVLWRHLGWKVGVPAAAVATLVSASRVEQRQHFMSDVAFGAVIGIASARTVTMGHVAGRRITIAPVPVPRGVAVMATFEH